MRYRRHTILARDGDLPDSKCVPFHRRRGTIPVVCRLLATSIRGESRILDRTEIANQVSLNGIWGPFPVGDVTTLGDVEPELLVALTPVSRNLDKRILSMFHGTLLNFSNPPSVELIFRIHSCA
jgi:hypothetical protein